MSLTDHDSVPTKGRGRKKKSGKPVEPKRCAGADDDKDGEDGDNAAGSEVAKRARALGEDEGIDQQPAKGQPRETRSERRAKVEDSDDDAAPPVSSHAPSKPAPRGSKAKGRRVEFQVSESEDEDSAEAATGSHLVSRTRSEGTSGSTLSSFMPDQRYASMQLDSQNSVDSAAGKNVAALSEDEVTEAYGEQVQFAAPASDSDDDVTDATTEARSPLQKKVVRSYNSSNKAKWSVGKARKGSPKVPEEAPSTVSGRQSERVGGARATTGKPDAPRKGRGARGSLPAAPDPAPTTSSAADPDAPRAGNAEVVGASPAGPGCVSALGIEALTIPQLKEHLFHRGLVQYGRKHGKSNISTLYTCSCLCDCVSA